MQNVRESVSAERQNRSVRLSLKRPGWLVLASHAYVAPSRLFWILQSAGWGTLAAIAFGRAITVSDFWAAIVGSAALVASGLLVSLLWRAAVRQVRSVHLSPIAFAAGAFGAAAVGGVLWYAINEVLLDAAAILSPLSRTADFEMPRTLDSIGIRAGLLFIWTVLYAAIRSWMELELAGERLARAELATQTARLRAFQSQL